MPVSWFSNCVYVAFALVVMPAWQRSLKNVLKHRFYPEGFTNGKDVQSVT